MINEISVNLTSQFIIHKTTSSFDENFDPLGMNSRIEVAKFYPGQTFERTINEIKYNHLKIIASSDINLSYITSFDGNFDQLSMNNRIEAAKFEPGPTFENTINEIKANHLKIITSVDMNVSSITSNKPHLSSKHINPI